MKNQERDESSADQSENSEDISFEGEIEYKLKPEIFGNKYKLESDHKIHKLNENLDKQNE
jgi:hypothetical protein